MHTVLPAIKDIESGSMNSARLSLRIIWLTGLVCIVAGLSFFLNSITSKEKRDNQLMINQNDKQDSKSIDQLLLTSEDALLTDKKSFVNGALRVQWHNQEPDLNQGNDRTLLYENILKRKLQRVNRTRVSDFSIKPIPK